ncbi:MAG: SDR family NAD(P)-dependent oxidoreductase [Chloroherpetonaceae bacterium]
MIQFDFHSKVAVVTGSGKGIGKSIALKLLTFGGTVVFLTRSIDSNLIKESEHISDRAYFIECDVSNYDSVERSFTEILTRLGRIDILVNNASVAKSQSIDYLSLEDWNWVMNNNMTSMFLCSKFAVSAMKSQNYGKIVNISSIAGRDKSMMLGIAYTTSKAASIGFTKHLASEVAKYGINVNVVCPSPTDTPMMRSLMTPEIESSLISKIPLGYIQKPEQVANVVLFLASDESNYMTGSVIDINGGLL